MGKILSGRQIMIKIKYNFLIDIFNILLVYKGQKLNYINNINFKKIFLI